MKNRNKTRRAHARNRPDRGSVSIELALVVPIFLLLVTGIVDYGWYLSRSSRVVVAVRDGARIGATYVDDEVDTPPGAADARVRAALDDAGIPCGDGCSISAVEGSVDGVPSLTVSAIIPIEPITGLLPIPNEMTVQSTMALEIRDPDAS
ncbi:MAG: pilus assembly protein [Deltaproteobacteria bacterium]|nr:pilus assembly protein [Deltaproteobacteria bacterium]